MTRPCTVVCALGAAALLAGCGGGHSAAGKSTTAQRPTPPPRVYKVRPRLPRIEPFPARVRNGMRCSYRLFSDGSGPTTVGTCFLGH